MTSGRGETCYAFKGGGFGSQRMGRNLWKVRKSRLYLQRVTEKDTVWCLRGCPPRASQPAPRLLGIPGGWNFGWHHSAHFTRKTETQTEELVQDCTAVRDRAETQACAKLTPACLSLQPLLPQLLLPQETWSSKALVNHQRCR